MVVKFIRIGLLIKDVFSIAYAVLLFEVNTSLFEKAVSIGTVFPNKSYMEKYVINNCSYPEGTAKHPKKMHG